MTNDFLMLMQIENFLLKEENCHWWLVETENSKEQASFSGLTSLSPTPTCSWELDLSLLTEGAIPQESNMNLLYDKINKLPIDKAGDIFSLSSITNGGY